MLDFALEPDIEMLLAEIGGLEGPAGRRNLEQHGGKDQDNQIWGNKMQCTAWTKQ